MNVYHYILVLSTITMFIPTIKKKWTVDNYLGLVITLIYLCLIILSALN